MGCSLTESSCSLAGGNPAWVTGHLSWSSTWISAPGTFPWHPVVWDLGKKTKLQIKYDPTFLKKVSFSSLRQRSPGRGIGLASLTCFKVKIMHFHGSGSVLWALSWLLSCCTGCVIPSSCCSEIGLFREFRCLLKESSYFRPDIWIVMCL